MSSSPQVVSEVMMKLEEEVHRCKGCGSNALFLDWKAGDRVCTNCGVVDEERVRDTRPEWKDYDEAEDLVKGLPSLQRCSLIPNDETKYVGGLQPTILSRTINTSSSSRLLKTHRKINRIIDKLHGSKVREMKIKRSNKDFGEEEESNDDTQHVRVKEEDGTNALLGSKWSFERAIMLHGTYDELPTSQSYSQYCKEKEELTNQITPSDKIASEEVYNAYLFTVNAVRQLSLPTHFIADCMNITCQYATNQNGFKGISRYTDSNQEEKKLQKQKNKLQQIASLSAAVIYILAKKNGYAKSLSHVCSIKLSEESLVKPKSCSKAIAQLQIDFPSIFQSLLSPSVEVVNLVQSTTSSLDLPNVAIDVIREVVRYVAKQHLLDDNKKQDNTKLVTICAACTYFVCCTGEIMQRLAMQALKKQDHSSKKRCRSSTSPCKKRPCVKQELKIPSVTPEPSDIKLQEQTELTSLVSLTSNSNFDVFTTPSTTPQSNILQGWYAWNNTKKWNRTIQQIQQSCHVTVSTQIIKFFKYKLFPIREQILNVVQDYFGKRYGEDEFFGFRDVDVCIAAPLMKNS